MTEHRRADVFKLCHWRRFLGVLLTARRSNQSILKEINPDYSLKGLLLKLKLQYFGHLIQRAKSLQKTLLLGRNWGQEEKGTTKDEMAGWHHWLNGHEFQFRELVMDREAWRAVIHGVTESQTRLSDWTELNFTSNDDRAMHYKHEQNQYPTQPSILSIN